MAFEYFINEETDHFVTDAMEWSFIFSEVGAGKAIANYYVGFVIKNRLTNFFCVFC